MKHIMKDPLDLDPFAADQIDLTRVFDAGGKPKIQQMIHFCLNQMHLSDSILIGSISLDQWQRAAYELAQMKKSDDGASCAILAHALWLVVQYIQESVKATEDAIEDPETEKEFSRFGVKLPKLPRE